MKKVLRLFIRKHNFIISKWETKPTSYERDTLKSFATEYVCSKCGRREDESWDFNKTECK